MIIIIDGYNFLKSITGSKFIDDRQMIDWMQKFNNYMKLRGNNIIVVFDAGPSFFEQSDTFGSVKIMYAGQHQTADDLIKKWMEKNKDLDVLLVSSDRVIRGWAQDLALVSISSQDFYKIFNDVMKQEKQQEDFFEMTLHKTQQTKNNNIELDRLMDFGSRNLVQHITKKEYDTYNNSMKSDKNSKSDKFLLKKINKI